MDGAGHVSFDVRNATTVESTAVTTITNQLDGHRAWLNQQQQQQQGQLLQCANSQVANLPLPTNEEAKTTHRTANMTRPLAMTRRDLSPIKLFFFSVVFVF